MDNVHPLRAYREREQITQGELARSLGVARETVARWESDARKINRNRLPEVSERTGIPASELRPDLARLFDQPEATE